MYVMDLSGEYEVLLSDGTKHRAVLPESLDENQIGYKDQPGKQWHPADGLGEADERNSALLSGDIIKTRLTRKYTYEGEATFTRTFIYALKEGKRVFLDIERARKITSCKINGHEAECVLKGTLSTPYCFELTDYLKEENEIEITSDNTYPGWPKEAIIYSSAATDETQTNWNGLLGTIRLREEEANFVSWIRVYPSNNELRVVVSVDVASEEYIGSVSIETEAMEIRTTTKGLKLSKGRHDIIFDKLILCSDVQYWDEYEGNLYKLTAGINGDDFKSVSFGVRNFSGKGGYLTNNGHRIFLRSESNCCVFPETGHMPLAYDKWLEIMEMYKRYGVNCVRFHSHCPPEAAFAAADSLGMFVQPELSHWNPNDAFETKESRSYYELEMRQILSCYANHPSFVMLTLGNELNANEDGAKEMSRLLALARELDATRLYAEGSNAWYGTKGAFKDSDFYTSCGYYDKDLRGTNCNMEGYINNKYPDAKTNYDETIAKIRESYDKPVFSFEVGQFEILPDFDELSGYHGVTRPDNIKNVYDEINKAGFLDDWKNRVEVTGELSLLAYREEVEAAMRTEDMSGISLLGLQDFTGQGTALVGMLNPHLEPKPYDFAKPERFRKFFTSVLPLVLLDKYTYFADETFRAEVVLANYSKETVCDKARYELWDESILYAEGTIGKEDKAFCECGKLASIGFINVEFEHIGVAKRLDLKVFVGDYTNEYSIFVYERKEAAVPKGVVAVAGNAKDAKRLLLEGKNVYFEPDFDKEEDGGLGILLEEEEKISSIKTCFTTDFWSVGTFAAQEGYMGCMIDTKHPIFAKFPTRFYPEWQWWIITKARAMVIPKTVDPLLPVIDCYARLRRMAFMFERKIGTGRLLVNSLGLLGKQEYPEARALLKSIYAYMESEEFSCENDCSKYFLN